MIQNIINFLFNNSFVQSFGVAEKLFFASSVILISIWILSLLLTLISSSVLVLNQDNPKKYFVFLEKLVEFSESKFVKIFDFSMMVLWKIFLLFVVVEFILL